ncbi:Calvin cycle protein CP12-3 [Hibiscus syriacus]|uniref:Calvin cycle protein CP12-3 n=1 Tax=Hibiscus syriacus TaxID=106335 RepID=A0A6A3AEC9_HIBSY|nr:calvin cycle protein CP12-3, chloroplastic-like [Hibiscus syriacus]KAE8702153.1 Calvin cycle protein CP12-3 [Hibiscus syriacus]
MATVRLNSLTGTRGKIPTSSFVSNPSMLSPSFRCHKKWVSRRMTVNAMGCGGAKHKGTQMREKQLTEMIKMKVTEAKQVCEGDDTSDECKVAWDEVEEVSQAKADLRLRLEVEKKDPLESVSGKPRD